MRLRADRKDQRRAEATERNADWRALRPVDQLASLAQRRGLSQKQRSKILARDRATS